MFITVLFYAILSANLPIGLYILLALISFFFFNFSQSISGSTGPIFTFFTTNGGYLFEFY